jgi:hypothetical protein
MYTASYLRGMLNPPSGLEPPLVAHERGEGGV